MPIILTFNDVQPMAFPYPESIAQEVTSTFGPLFAKDIISNRSMLVVDHIDNTPTTCSSFAYARNSDGTVDEIARSNYTVDAGLTKGTYSVGCLRVDPLTSTKTIENVLEADHESLIVTSTSAADSTKEQSTLLGYDGISFSADNTALYFGANQEFRLRFGRGEQVNGGNLFLIESKSPVTGLYTVRSSYSDII
jgi:hypothetical protein